MSGHSIPLVQGFYDERTGSVQYVVSCPTTKACAIIDPVLDFDEKSGAVASKNADMIMDYIASHDLRAVWILDTHPHADHFSAAHYLKQKTGAPTGIGERVKDVQQIWAKIYNCPEMSGDLSHWDRLFADGDVFQIGDIDARVIYSPGHTIASITYVIGDAAFIHDTLFMPDSGTARADFPGGGAEQLWNSIQALLSLPENTRLFTGHDYRPSGRDAMWESTVADQKRSNLHLIDKSKAEFIAAREARDRTLPMPKLILPALQVNIRGGRLPRAEDNGTAFLKIPIGVFPFMP